ncbi:MAG: EamA family transporter [Zoogloeaceae bacterium]|nr:EamA family transporter [Zoogloeaceae bacterium]
MTEETRAQANELETTLTRYLAAYNHHIPQRALISGTPASMQSLWMIVASFLFAGMGVCVKLSAQAGYAPAEIVFYRAIVALFIMALIVILRRVPLKTPHWRMQMKRGVTGFCSLSVYFCAIALVPLATAVTLNYTSPLFLMLLLIVFRGLKPSLPLMLSLACGLLGVALLLHPGFAAEAWLGETLALASGFLAAMTYFDVRELGLRGEPEARTVFYFALLATFLSAIWIAFSRMHPLRLEGICMLAGVGIFATLGQLAMTRAYSRGNVLLSASLAYTTVVFATLFGVLFWEEHLDGMELTGMLLIMASGIMANRFSAK